MQFEVSNPEFKLNPSKHLSQSPNNSQLLPTKMKIQEVKNQIRREAKNSYFQSRVEHYEGGKATNQLKNRQVSLE